MKIHGLLLRNLLYRGFLHTGYTVCKCIISPYSVLINTSHNSPAINNQQTNQPINQWTTHPPTSMEQSLSSEVNRSSAWQENPRSLRNPKFNYHIHNSPPLIPDWATSVQSTSSQPTSFKIHPNITLPSMFKPFTCPLLLSFTHQNSVCTSHLLLHTFYTCVSKQNKLNVVINPPEMSEYGYESRRSNVIFI
jgi:hypothetical protein